MLVLSPAAPPSAEPPKVSDVLDGGKGQVGSRGTQAA